MSSARQELLRLLAHKSFRLGEFKLSSGGTSDYYIDCRTTTLDARGRTPHRRGLPRRNPQARMEPASHRRPDHGRRPDRRSGLHRQRQTPRIPGAQSRKAARHRTAHRRLPRKRPKVVIVDDVCTTGASDRSGDRSRTRVRIRSRRRDVPGGTRRSQRPAERGESRSACAVHLDFHGEDVRAEHVLQNDTRAGILTLANVR